MVRLWISSNIWSEYSPKIEMRERKEIFLDSKYEMEKHGPVCSSQLAHYALNLPRMTDHHQKNTFPDFGIISTNIEQQGSHPRNFVLEFAILYDLSRELKSCVCNCLL